MKSFPLGSLRIRLILLVLLAAVPALALTLFTGWEERNASALAAQHDALNLATLASADQDLLVESTRHLLISLARLPELRQDDPAACSALFADLFEQYPLYANLIAVKPNGDLWCSAVPPSGAINFDDRAWYQELMRTRDFTVGGYVIGRVTNKPIATFAYPLLDKAGQVQIIVSAAVDLAWLNRLITHTELPSGSTLTVIDGNGVVLARNLEPEKWVGQDVSQTHIVKMILASQSQGTVESIGVDGVNRLYAFSPLGSTPQAGKTYVYIGIPTAVAYAQANQILTRNLIALGLVTVLVLVVAWLAGDYFLLRRIKSLLRATRRLTDGDFSARTELAYGIGELSQLSRTFDQMAEALQQREQLRKNAEEALRESEVRFRRLTENAQDLIYRYEFNPKRGFTYVSPAATLLTGYTPEEHYADPDLGFKLVHPEDYPLLEQYFQGKGTLNQPLTLRWIRKNGEVIFAEQVNVPTYDEAGNLTAIEGIARDISERKRAELELKYISLHDALTGLYNRGFFEAEMARLESGRQFPVSIIMADVDQLKETNDRYGHAVGDVLLKRVAQVLTKSFRSEDVVARIGGDEFAVLLPGAGMAAAEDALHRVRKLLLEHNVAHSEILVRLSFGVSTAEKPATLNDILKEADRNMYRAKRDHHIPQKDDGMQL
jgi:diguanylate cyclase (GGDEF)-like protein/PAS domain S-box-containing protein